MMIFKRNLCALAWTMLAVACGGGGTSGGGNAYVSGVAAYGLPMAGASIVVTDSGGRTVTAVADADGRYTANVSGFVAPMAVTAAGMAGDAAKKYVSLLDTTPSPGTIATVNVTPLTHALAALVSSDGISPDEFGQDSGKLQNLDRTNLARALGNLQGTLANILADVGLPPTFDPVRTPFAADRSSGGDLLLDTVSVSLGNGGVLLTNRRVPIVSGSQGSAATVMMSSKMDTPPAPLPIPSIAVAELQGLDAWIAQFNACLALAPSARVSNASGTYTLLGACDGMTSFSPTYKRNGYTLAQVWGPRLEKIPQGARARPPQILNMWKNDAADSFANVRLAYFTDTVGASFIETARKVAGRWLIEGNQRHYDAGVTVALIRQADVSANAYTVGNIGGYPDSGKNVGRFSAYLSALFFDFNLQGPNASDVYAARIKGPGLPAAGVVLARSSACGMSKLLAFYSNDGSLPAADATATPTPAAGNSWILDVKNFGAAYTGTDFFNQFRGITSAGLPSTSKQNAIAAVPVDVDSIPEFARYSWEVFTAASGTTPAGTFAVSLTTRPLPASSGSKQGWAELTADAMGYVQPPQSGSPKAGALSQGTVSWTLPPGAAPVTNAFINGASSTQRASMNGTVTAGATSQDLAISPSAELNGVGARACQNAVVPAYDPISGFRSAGTVQKMEELILEQLSLHVGRPAPLLH